MGWSCWHPPVSEQNNSLHLCMGLPDDPWEGGSRHEGRWAMLLFSERQWTSQIVLKAIRTFHMDAWKTSMKSAFQASRTDTGTSCNCTNFCVLWASAQYHVHKYLQCLTSHLWAHAPPFLPSFNFQHPVSQHPDNRKKHGSIPPPSPLYCFLTTEYVSWYCPEWSGTNPNAESAMVSAHWA